MSILHGILITIITLFISRLISSKINSIINKEPTLKQKDDKITQDMVKCSECGTYIAKTNAYIVNGKTYCKKEH